MNGKLPANNFTCPQSYLRPNILYYQGGPQIQQQNQAMPGVPTTSYLVSHSPPTSQDLDAQLPSTLLQQQQQQLHKKDCQKVL